VAPAGVDGGGGAAHTQVHRGEGGHLAGRIAEGGGAVLAQAAVGAGAPALDRAVVEQGTRVVERGGDGRGGAPRPEVDRGERRHLAGSVADGGGAVPPQLPVAALAPALDGGVVEQGAAVVVAGGDGRGGAPGAEVHGGQCGHLAGGVALVGGAVDAQLAEGVETPALDRAVVEQRARVGAAGGHRGGAPTRAEVDGREEGHLAVAVTLVEGVALAQLPGAVQAPALDAGVGHQCARVQAAGADGGGGGRVADGDGHGVGRQRGGLGRVDGRRVHTGGEVGRDRGERAVDGVARAAGEVGDRLDAIGGGRIGDRDPRECGHPVVDDGEVVVDDPARGHAGLISGQPHLQRLAQVHRGQRRHLAGLVAQRDGRVLPELAQGVEPPALDGVVVQPGTRVDGAGGDRGGGAAGTEVHRGEAGHLTGLVAQRHGAVLPQLALGAAAPALDGAVVEQGARVGTTGADGRGGATRTEVHGRQCSHLARGVADVVGVSLARRPVGAPTPALDGGVVEQGAGAERAGADCGGGAPGAQVDGGENGHLAGLVAQGGGAALAQLAAGAVAPTLDGGVVEQCARVAAAGAGRDGGGGTAGPQVHRRHGRDVARVAADAGGAVLPQLPVEVVAPALDGGVVEDRARVLGAGGDGGGSAAGAQVDGGEGGHLAGLVAQVAEAA